MNLVGIMPVRNEDWCLELSMLVALSWCDQLIILLHACNDRSEDIAMALAEQHHGRVIVVADYVMDWHEMRHRQALLELARADDVKATHIAIIDADEIVTQNMVDDYRSPIVKTMAEAIAPGSILHLPGYNLRHGLDTYHLNGIWGRRWFSTVFADMPNLGWTGNRFHQREPVGHILRPVRIVPQGHGGVLHLWGASERRLLAKHALYKVTERLRWPDRDVDVINAMYNQATDRNPEAAIWSYATVPREWLYSGNWPAIDLDREPWQEEEVRRLVRLNPGIQRGLDLFGVISGV